MRRKATNFIEPHVAQSQGRAKRMAVYDTKRKLPKYCIHCVTNATAGWVCSRKIAREFDPEDRDLSCIRSEVNFDSCGPRLRQHR